MDAQPLNGRGAPGPEAMARDALQTLWSLFEERQTLEAEGAAERAWIAADHVGGLLAEVERLKGELRAAHQGQPGDELGIARVPRALVAALELLARDMRAYREAEQVWIVRRGSQQETLDRYQRVLDSLALLERARHARPWDEVLRLTTDELRALADAGAQS